jgi:chorismate-pyruvate lyase
MSMTRDAGPSATIPDWEIEELDPFDRMLLTTDGTVTTLLEACAGEPIVTMTTRQSGPSTLDQLVEATGRWWLPNAHLLRLSPTERMVARRVTLRGVRTGVAYVLAESLVAPDRLPGLIADDFRHAGASLGRLLAAGRLETRRDIIEISTVRAAAAGDHLHVAPSARLVRRCYTILIGARPVAVVSEWLAPGRLAAASRG